MALGLKDKKVRDLCNFVERDVLGPAKIEASKILESAKLEASKIVEAANEKAKEIFENRKKEIDRCKKRDHDELLFAVKMSISKVKNGIAEIFLNEWQNSISTKMQEKDVVGSLCSVVLDFLSKDGDLEKLKIAVPKSISKKHLASFLGVKLKKVLGKSDVEVGGLHSGIFVKDINKKISVEISEKTICSLLSEYVEDSLRTHIFK